MSVTFADLLACLRGIPDLPGARCRGRHHLFDAAAEDEQPPAVEHRHRAALELCAGCPVLAACGAWVASLRPKDRPAGVIAGRIHHAKKSKSNAA